MTRIVRAHNFGISKMTQLLLRRFREDPRVHSFDMEYRRVKENDPSYDQWALKAKGLKSGTIKITRSRVVIEYKLTWLASAASGPVRDALSSMLDAVIAEG